MEEFLKERKAKIEEELRQLYIDRGRCSIETEGSYDIMIDRKKRELNKLNSHLDSSSAKIEIKPDDVDFRAEIKNLIAEGEIKEAIQKLMNNSEDNQLIMLSARYNRVEKQNNSGIITQDNFSIELNKITNSLLSILND